MVKLKNVENKNGWIFIMHPSSKARHKVESNYRECSFALHNNYEGDNISTLRWEIQISVQQLASYVYSIKAVIKRLPKINKLQEIRAWLQIFCVVLRSSSMAMGEIVNTLQWEFNWLLTSTFDNRNRLIRITNLFYKESNMTIQEVTFLCECKKGEIFKHDTEMTASEEESIRIIFPNDGGWTRSQEKTKRFTFCYSTLMVIVQHA